MPVHGVATFHEIRFARATEERVLEADLETIHREDFGYRVIFSFGGFEVTSEPVEITNGPMEEIYLFQNPGSTVCLSLSLARRARNLLSLASLSRLSRSDPDPESWHPNPETPNPAR